MGGEEAAKRGGGRGAEGGMNNVAWFSCGVASAVTCLMRPDWDWVYIEISSAHPDNERFIKEVEAKTGKKIIRKRSEKYADQFEVIRKRRYINGPAGAACTTVLKRDVRDSMNITGLQAFGYTVEERHRAERLSLLHPELKAVFPLIQEQFTKQMCHDFLKDYGIDAPRMYTLGYQNNNCIGCVKGGKKYWQKIRKDFPAYFAEMSKLEREVGATCINGTYLDELPIEQPSLFVELPECGGFCETV